MSSSAALHRGRLLFATTLSGYSDSDALITSGGGYSAPHASVEHTTIPAVSTEAASLEQVMFNRPVRSYHSGLEDMARYKSRDDRQRVTTRTSHRQVRLTSDKCCRRRNAKQERCQHTSAYVSAPTGDRTRHSGNDARACLAIPGPVQHALGTVATGGGSTKHTEITEAYDVDTIHDTGQTVYSA